MMEIEPDYDTDSPEVTPRTTSQEPLLDTGRSTEQPTGWGNPSRDAFDSTYSLTGRDTKRDNNGETRFDARRDNGRHEGHSNVVTPGQGEHALPVRPMGKRYSLHSSASGSLQSSLQTLDEEEHDAGRRERRAQHVRPAEVSTPEIQARGIRILRRYSPKRDTSDNRQNVSHFKDSRGPPGIIVDDASTGDLRDLSGSRDGAVTQVSSPSTPLSPRKKHKKRGRLSSSGSKSSAVEIEIERDEEFNEGVNEMMRRSTLARSAKGRRSSRRRSFRESLTRRQILEEAGKDGSEGGAAGQLYKENSSEEELFERIKVHKEIIHDIRQQPWRMKRKLKTLRVAKAYVEKYEGRLSRSHGYQEAGAKYWRRLKRELTNVITFFIPWEMRIKKIESHFGSVVSSYFTFLRWLFWVNIILTVLTICFIVVPEALVGDPFDSTERKSIPDAEKERALDFKTIWDFEKSCVQKVHKYVGTEGEGSDSMSSSIATTKKIEAKHCKYETMNQRWGNAGTALKTLHQRHSIIGSALRFAGRRLLFLNNEYAYLFIRAHQPLNKTIHRIPCYAQRIGEGYLKYSYLFYGYYGNAPIIGEGYRLPLAYFLAGLSTYGVSFIVILRRMAKNSRLSKLSSKDEQFTFSWKLYTTWDYMIGNAETGRNKAAEIVTSLRESILEEQEKKKEENRKLLLFLRFIANILVLMVLASSTYAIYLVVERSREVETRIEQGLPVSWWEQNEVAIVMSLITVLFPSLFDLIGMMEKFHPRVNLRWQLARILVLYLLNLYTLMFALFWKIKDKVDRNVPPTNITSPCNVTSSPTPPTYTYPLLVENATTTLGAYIDITTPASDNCTIFWQQTENNTNSLICWETMLGQEMFKLTVFDLIITFASIVLIDFVRGVFVRYMNNCCCWDLEKKFPEYGEFKIAENLLHLIYNQAMIWMGTFFSPLLPCFNLVKLLIMLYLRSWAVLMCNVPHERVFRASRSNNFYYSLLLLMLFLVTLPVAFLLVMLEPSKDCGPFSDFERTYHVFSRFIEDEFPDWLAQIFDYIASPAVIIPLFLLLIMAIYYLISLTRSLKDVNSDLRLQLHIERTEEKKKIYAMADAKRAQKKKALEMNVSSGSVDKERDDDGAIVAVSGSDMADPSHGLKIVRIPGITAQQAAELKARNPALRIMTAAEARRLQLLPSGDQSGPHLLPPRDRSSQGGGPPVAVVHGNPLHGHDRERKLEPKPQEISDLDRF